MRSTLIQFTFVLVMAVVASELIHPRAAQSQTFGYQDVGKSCGRCGRTVSLGAQVGDNCPHCGAYWGGLHRRFSTGPAPMTPMISPTAEMTSAMPTLGERDEFNRQHRQWRKQVNQQHRLWRQQVNQRFRNGTW